MNPSHSISSLRPTSFIFMLDCSGSMVEKIHYRGVTQSKSQATASIINNLISELVNRTKRDGSVKEYYTISVVGYGNGELYGLSTGDFSTMSDLSSLDTALHNHTILRKLPSGKEFVSVVEERQWWNPQAEGSTNMYDAFMKVSSMVSDWCSDPSHADCIAPMVINITDGVCNDAIFEDLIDLCGRIKRVGTNVGKVTLMNIHLNTNSEASVLFPTSLSQVGDNRYSQLLYEISSDLPEVFNTHITKFLETHPTPNPPFKAVGVNASLIEVLSMLNIGSVSYVML